MQILNQIILTELPQWVKVITLIGVIIMVVGTVMVLGISTTFDSVGTVTVGVLLCCVGTVFGITGLIAKEKVEPVPTGIIQYEVLIDESTNFQEVYDKYEVIERRGDIWVLQDKEAVE